MKVLLGGICALLALLATAAPAAAQRDNLAVRDSFRIGSQGVQCSAQLRPLDSAARGMFDRAYAIVCQDAAAEVGRLYVLRTTKPNPLGALIADRAKTLDCSPLATANVDRLPRASLAECTRRADGLPYRVYALARAPYVYVSEGLRGYDSAIALGLRTLVANRPVAGAVEVAVTQAGDAAAFARTQAGSLDTQAAMNEGYLRNNSGSFAEAAAFFGSLVDNGKASDLDSAEYLLNSGLQQSNLGNAAAAERAFVQAEAGGAAANPVLARMLRNYRAMALLNRRDIKGTIAMLDTPVAPLAGESSAELAGGSIGQTLSDQINRENTGSRRLGAVDQKLRPYERAQILDAQAALLRGIALRLSRRNAEALVALDQARATLMQVRAGKVVSAAFLQAEILAESALTEEAQGNYPAADRDLVQSVRMLDVSYPRSAAGLMAKARLAAYRARRGDVAAALLLYGQVVDASADTPGGGAPLRDQLRPYFALLAQPAATDPDAVARMFAASQILTRPGLAQTQAVLARELSAGDDDAARLFRDAVNASRQVTRATGDVATLADPAPRDGTPEASALAAARDHLKDAQAQQVELQAKLSAYPRYRVIDPDGLALADLQKTLRPHEAYYEMRVLGDEAYAMLITAGGARAARIPATAGELGDEVAGLRASIVRIDNGRFVTDPFDLALSRKLYLALFGPFGDALGGVDHLIFEPDGPLLQLPANLLVTDQQSVDGYAARMKRRSANPFDFTGVAWLGRGRDVTTAVSPKSFVDVRAAPASRATLTYLGLGHNARPNPMTTFLAAQPASAPADPCAWPSATWNNPVSADELFAARDLLGASQSAVVTGAAFADTAIAQRTDLANYRVVHFATHGLVTAPRPECPARPALLTSFGAGASDGLLTFREIYDLRIDADVVILSACDTAGMATIAATREAGVSTGGNFALDGLVRAFVGAGARTVIASHWPVPDDFDATKRLILGTVGAPKGTPVATALRRAETALMDDPRTSHPYYWAAFAVVGDGERPLSSGK